MTEKIYPCFWHNGTAKEAAELYIAAFGEGSIKQDLGVVVNFELFGQKFININGGPEYQMNPSISMFVVFEDEASIQKAWDALSAGGKTLMEFNQYPWAQKYGWVQDKYGLSWQLSLSEHHQFPQRITPLFMFTGDLAGKAKEAMEFYTQVFPNSKIDLALNYSEGEGDKPELLKHAQFTLDNHHFMAMDSSGPHQFTFNEGISLVVDCDGQEEVDMYWDTLLAGGQESQCGWLKDKYNVSWQVVPKQLAEALANSDREKAAFAMQAMLKMKKIIIADLTQH